MASESNHRSSNSGVLRSERLSVGPYSKPTVMAEPEQPGYIRPRYTATVTGECASNDDTSWDKKLMIDRHT